MSSAGAKVLAMLEATSGLAAIPRAAPKCSACIRQARIAWRDRRELLEPRECHSYMTPDGRGPFYLADCKPHADAELDARIAEQIKAASDLGEKGRDDVERLQALQRRISIVRSKRGSVVAAAIDPRLPPEPPTGWWEHDQ